jgi:hypothetical protein
MFANEAGAAYHDSQPGDPDHADLQELWLIALADLRVCRAAITTSYTACKAS